MQQKSNILIYYQIVWKLGIYYSLIVFDVLFDWTKPF